MAHATIAADLQQLTKNEIFAASDLAYSVRVILPVVDDGTGATTDNNVLFVIAARSTGGVEVLDELGRRVRYVRPRTAIILRSTDGTLGKAPRWVLERPGMEEAAKINDLTATNLVAGVAASAVDYEATYVELEVEAATDAAVDALAADIVTKTSVIFEEIEGKLNRISRALMVGLGVGLDNTVAAGGTLALADSAPSALQLVDDDEKLVTSARAQDLTVVLPDIVDGATGAAVDDGYVIRLEANSTGGIRILDYDHTFVGFVKPFTNARVQSSLASDKPWQFMPQDGYEIALGLEGGMSLEVTAVTPAASAAAFGATYGDDATFSTAADVAIDAMLASVDTDCDAAFDEIDAFIAKILKTLETNDVQAES